MRTNAWQLGLAVDNASVQSSFGKKKTSKTPTSFNHYVNSFENFAVKRQTSLHALNYPRATYVSKPPNIDAEKAARKRSSNSTKAKARVTIPEGKKKIKSGVSADATKEVYLKNTEDVAKKQAPPKAPKTANPIF